MCEIFLVGLRKNINFINAFYFEQLNDNAKSLDIVMALLSAIWTFVFIFMVCEPVQRVTNQFEMFNKELSRCVWYELPNELQQMYLIFLSDTQQAKTVACYGNIECSRDTFKKVFGNENFIY